MKTTVFSGSRDAQKQAFRACLRENGVLARADLMSLWAFVYCPRCAAIGGRLYEWTWMDADMSDAACHAAKRAAATPEQRAKDGPELVGEGAEIIGYVCRPGGEDSEPTTGLGTTPDMDSGRG
jgi:hypothetical protein